MATKKKKRSTKKKAVPRVKAKRRPAAKKKIARKKKSVRRIPLPQKSAASVAFPSAEPSSFSGNDFLLLLALLGLLSLGWLVWNRQIQTKRIPAVAAETEAVGAPPEARRPMAPEENVAPVAAPKMNDAPATRRETAGELTATTPETGAPSLVFDRSLGKPLSVRCYRSEGGQAVLDVFASRNRLIASLRSAAGPAGMVELSWDGKDGNGKKVPVGLYFLRPTQKDAQSIRDIWVKD